MSTRAISKSVMVVFAIASLVLFAAGQPAQAQDLCFGNPASITCTVTDLVENTTVVLGACEPFDNPTHGHLIIEPVGNTTNDVAIGSSAGDVIGLNGGNDDACGGAGQDVISLGNGTNRALGEAGNDIIVGGSGPDNIRGGGGNDVLLGADGNDTIVGQAGNDTCLGGNGADIIVQCEIVYAE